MVMNSLIKINFIESFKTPFYLIIVTLVVFLSSKYLFASFIHKNLGLMEIGAIGLFFIILNTIIIINSAVDFISSVNNKIDRRNDASLIKNLSNLLYYSVVTIFISIFFWVKEKYENDYFLMGLIVGFFLVFLIQNCVSDKLKSRLHG
ncbi:hypothetical protein AMD27_16290 (plasmid) [Acinetobacter sp. TGL-Y2]|nr:hypothetical protein AMD27_16290 [Acinetobacter sp. TGL-Y2]